MTPSTVQHRLRDNPRHGLRRALQQPMELSSIELDVDAAVGIAVHPDHGTDPEILLQRADLATHAAKQLSVPVQMFNQPGVAVRAPARARRRPASRDRARRDRGLFQPKVTLVGRRVIGVQCVARWEHPAHETVAPVEFVAVAEHPATRPADRGGPPGGAATVPGLARRGPPAARGGQHLAPDLGDMNFPTQVAALLEEYLVPASLLTWRSPRTDGKMTGAEASRVLDRARATEHLPLA